MLSPNDWSHDAQMKDISELDWFMNKLSGSRVIKTLNITSGRNGKMRSMEDILVHHQRTRGAEMNLEQTRPPWGEDEGYSSASHVARSSTVFEFYASHNIEAENEKEESQNLPLAADENTDIERMTLKEMQHLLKKTSLKSSKGQKCLGLSLTPPSDVNVSSVSQMSPDNSPPVTVLELQLDDSSNSADSTDYFLENRGMGSPHHNLDNAFREGHYPRSEGYFKRFESREGKADCWMDSVATDFPAKTVIQDDEWTLGMWQSYHKQHSRRKNFKGCGNVRFQKASERIQKQISSGPTSCSLNSVPAIDWDSASPPEFPSIPSICSLNLQEDYESQGSPNGAAQEVGNDKMDEMQGLFKDAPCMKEILNETVEANPHIEENSSSPCGASLTCAAVRLVLDDESDIGPSKSTSPKEAQEKQIKISSWQVKPCSKPPTPTSFKATGSITEIFTNAAVTHEIINVSDHQTTGSSVHGWGSRDVIKSEGRIGNAEAGRNTNCVAADGTDVSEHSGLMLGLSNKKTEFCEKDLSGENVRVAQDTNHRIEYRCKRVGSDDGLESRDGSTEGNVGAGYKEWSDEVPATLLAMETLDDEEDQEFAKQQPAKFPCKRRAISPLSREKLLQASNCIGSGFNELENRSIIREPKRLFKGYIGEDNFNREWMELSIAKKGFISGDSINESSSPLEKLNERGEALVGSPCHNKDPSHLWQKPLSSSKPLVSKVSLPSPSVSTAVPSQHPSSHAQKLCLGMNNSPSPPPQHDSKASVVESATPPLRFSPSIPAKGILRSNSQTCQGACRCEECMSLRSRADKASEFSQRQMQDIECLAVKLLKELSNMRSIVQEKILQGSRSQSPLSEKSLDQVKKAANNALDTEETTKKWLVRMARDCNRYCKIARMQQRRLSFADESGGQLCHVKLFRSETNSLPCISTAELSVEGSMSCEEVDRSIEAREQKQNYT